MNLAYLDNLGPLGISTEMNEFITLTWGPYYDITRDL